MPAALFRIAQMILSMVGGCVRLLSGGRHLLPAPNGGDFIIYYAAAKLTLAGRGGEAFNEKTLTAVQRSVLAATPNGLTWNYPPVYQMLIAPLALLPYGWSYGVFMVATATPFVLLMRRIAGPSLWVPFLALAFPGAIGNVVDGQNGFLTCAILGWGLLLLEEKPVLAGAILGLLIYKPQFALILPVVFLGGKNWRSAASAGATALLVIAVSASVFGVGLWWRFLAALPLASQALGDGSLPWRKMPSVFVFVRSIGAGPQAAQAVQAIVGALAAAVAFLCWRRSAPHTYKVAVAVMAGLLMSPYAFNYDLVLLAIPLAIFASALKRRDRSASPAVGAALAAMALVPLVSLHFADLSPVQPTAMILLACFAVIAAATWRAGGYEPAFGALSSPAPLPRQS